MIDYRHPEYYVIYNKIEKLWNDILYRGTSYYDLEQLRDYINVLLQEKKEPETND